MRLGQLTRQNHWKKQEDKYNEKGFNHDGRFGRIRFGRMLTARAAESPGSCRRS
jgi:hypothetical protein